MTANANKRYEELNGTDKAAALIQSLPPEQAASVMKMLADAQVERLTIKLLERDQLAPEAQEQLLREAHELTTAQQFLKAGGVEYARNLLIEAFGQDHANELIERLVARMESQPFHYLRGVDASQIMMLLSNQHPQIIAMVLSYLSSEQAADILKLLPEHLQPQVSFRLANMDTASPSVIAQIEVVVKAKLSTFLDAESSRLKTGGVDYLVRVLRLVDRTTERSILESLEESAPDLADEIKKQMFVFENLTLLDDRSIQRVLREVDQRDLALALRSTTEAVRELVFKNMSSRAAATVRDEIENSPPVRLRTIEEAQQRIVEVVRRLEDADEITVMRSKSDVLL